VVTAPGAAPDHDAGDVLAEWAGDDITEVLQRMGRCLRALHGTDAVGCPWRQDVGDLVTAAAARVEAGQVDPARFDPPYRRYGPAQILALAERSVPAPPAVPVVVHGSARLSALRIEDGGLRWADLDGSGVGDPYRDLATMAVDLAAAVGPEALAPFLDAYGVDHPDVIRLDWHVLADQLLR
jgi:aminoglycoside phosphotransferase